MVKNEGARAMAFVRPGPTSLTVRKKAQARSYLSTSGLVLHAGTPKESLERAGEASEVE